MTGQYIVLDLEFNNNEIIQFSATRMISKNYGKNIEIGDSFDSYVKPVKPLKDDFKELTGINEEQLKNAPTFSKVLNTFEEWIKAPNIEHTFILTWGSRDEKILTSNCSKHNIKKFKAEFLDLQAYIMLLKGLKKLPSLESQVKDFIGEKHNSLNDSRNTALLFKHVLEDWVFA